MTSDSHDKETTAGRSASENDLLTTLSGAVSTGGTERDTVRALDEPPGRYTYLGEHAKGGMGRILIVHDEHLSRDIAMKELMPGGLQTDPSTPQRQSAALVSRFLREAKITGQLEHPSITPVYELGRKADGSLYYTMKLVRGKTLAQAIKECKTYKERLELLPHFVDLCHAIAYAHSRRVIHRDIKPSNVMVGDFGETVVIDWGLAKVKDDPTPQSDHEAETVIGMRADSGQQDLDDSGRTQHGDTLGTPAYMSPEQAKGDIQNVDERSDIFSLGAVLYEIITGEPPYTGKTVSAVLKQAQLASYKKPRAVNRQIPENLEKICLSALAEEPSKRCGSAELLARSVERWKPPWRYMKPLRRIALAALILTITLLLIVSVANMLTRRLHSQTIAKMREKGVILDASRLQGTRPPNTQYLNPREKMINIHRILHSWRDNWPAGFYVFDPDVDPREIYRYAIETSPTLLAQDDEFLRKAKAVIEQQAEMMAICRVIADTPPVSQHMIVNTYFQEATIALGDRIANFGGMRATARLILLRALVNALEGDSESATASLVTVLRLSNHCKDIPSSFAYYNGTGMISNTQSVLQKVLTLNILQKPELEQLVFEFANSFRRNYAPTLVNMEMLEYINIFQELRERPILLPLQWFFYLNEIEYLEFTALLIEKSQGLGKDMLSNVAELSEPDKMWVPLARMITWQHLNIPEHVVRGEMNLKVCVVALEIHIHFIEKGGFADTLDDMTSSFKNRAEHTFDLFTGESLTYRRNGDGFVIYSVGPDGIDNCPDPDAFYEEPWEGDDIIWLTTR